MVEQAFMDQPVAALLLFRRDGEELVEAEHHYIAKAQVLFLVYFHERTENTDRRFSRSDAQDAQFSELLFFADAILDFAGYIHRTARFGCEYVGVDFLEFSDDVGGIGARFEAARLVQFVISCCHLLSC